VKMRVSAVLAEQTGDDALGGFLQGGAEEFFFEAGLVWSIGLDDMEEGGAEESVLVCEAAVDGGRGDARVGGYAGDGAGFQAFVVEDAQGRLEKKIKGLSATLLARSK